MSHTTSFCQHKLALRLLLPTKFGTLFNHLTLIHSYLRFKPERSYA